ncbi:sulfotransferase [Akkermansiaceae bacterium]|nr:sulfotransferase [Akkermansiaceae bacterium]
MKPIFIICQHRTGSTLLKNILNRNSKVKMAFDEMNLYEPFRKNTLDKLIPHYINSIDELLKAIDQKQIYGTFWKQFEQSGIDRADLAKSFSKSVRFNEIEVLSKILSSLAGSENIRPGIKYPVHFSKIGVLAESFKSCRMVFLTRDPRAMIASKLNDSATILRKRKSIFNRFFIHYCTLLYFCIEYVQAQKKYKEFDRIGLVIDYEKLVQDDSCIRKICNFLDIEFESEMLNAEGKKSSFAVKILKHKPIYKSSNNRYRTALSRFDQWLIKILTKYK